MNMKKIMSIILTILLLTMYPINCYAKDKQNEDESIKANSVILMSMDTGEVLLKQNEYEHLSPASVTKIMTILIALEAIDSDKISLTDKVTASENAVSMGGSQIWLEVGETMTVDELLKAIVIASANDACTALGEYIAGSSAGFVKMMNDRVKELGLKNTNFENCTGLDDTTKNHYSCAYDLAVISCEVMKHELILDYTTVWLDSLRDGKTELNNTNKLVNTYNSITGLKTGTTSNAGFCVAATACRDNMNLVAVVLDAENSEDRFETAAYLLDYGFANYKLFKPDIDTDKITSVKVINGLEKSIIPNFDNNVSVIVENINKDYDYEYKLKESVEAPVTKGDTLGVINIIDGENIIASLELTSPRDIGVINFKYIFKTLIINI